MKVIQFIIVFFTFYLSIYSQETKIKFNHLTIKDGLSDNWVRCIYQDSYGYMWFGTGSGGLNKYDGCNFTVYQNDQKLKKCINSNTINFIYEDKNRKLWIGTSRGLHIYDRDSDNIIPIPSFNYICLEDIFELDNGKFILTILRDILLYEPKNDSIKHIINANDNQSIEFIEKGLLQYDNRLLVGTRQGLFYIDTIATKLIPIHTNIEIRSIFIDDNNRLWYGTQNKGLFYLTLNDGDISKPIIRNFIQEPNNENSISESSILAIQTDNKNKLWIGTGNDGLNILNLENLRDDPCIFSHIRNNPFDKFSVLGNATNTIFKDNEGTIWISTLNSGINYYNKKLFKFSHIKHEGNNKNSLNNNHINAIYQEGRYLWVGTQEGLNIQDIKTNKWEHFEYNKNNNKSLGAKAVCAIFRDSKKNMWIGTWEGGLNLFNESTKTFTRYFNDPDNKSSISSNNIFDIDEDENGILWIATMGGGLNRFDYKNNSFKSYTNNPDPTKNSDKWVGDIAMMDQNDEILLATSYGFQIFNTKSENFLHFIYNPNNPKSLSSNNIMCVFADSKKNIWLGTDNGLNLFNRDNSNFELYNIKDGLPNNVVRAICEDNHGNLWISTNKGLSKFINGTERPENPLFENFDMKDGLQENNFNNHSCFKDKSGKLYFGSINGLNVFNPDSIINDKSFTKLAYTDFLLFNKPVKIGTKGSPLKKNINLTNKITLPYNQKVITIGYTGINFLNQQKFHYAYILDGFDKEWNYVGKQKYATYTNLNPGKYTFRVKVSTNNIFWYEKESPLVITIKHPWWLTLWAKALYVLFILTLLYFFRKFSIISINLKKQLWMEHIEKKKSEELHQLKIQFFTNISHELRTPLTLIIGPLNKILKNNNITKELKIIKNNVNRLKTLVDQILYFRLIESNKMQLNLEYTDAVNFVKYIIFNFSEFAEQKNIDLIFNSEVKTLPVKIDKDKVEKIVANIMVNAIKYCSNRDSVIVSLNVDYESSDETNYLVIEIRDTGIGISRDSMDNIFNRFFTSNNNNYSIANKTGIGLHITKKLVEIYEGKISVSSEPGKGSVFTVSLPVDKDNKTTISNKEGITNIVTQYSRNNLQNILNIEASSANKQSILIIDDDIEICRYLESILIEEYNIEMETNPLNGINLSIKLMPDLIICDIMMPELEGTELCKQIKSDIRISHIPIILLTAKATTKDNIIGFEIGADAYIYKPFDDDLLKSRIKNLINQRKLLRHHFVGDDGIINSKISKNILDRSFIEKVVAIIRANFKDPNFHADNIIKDMNMSKSVFYAKFKALSDQSVNDLINTFRLKRSEELLLKTNMSITNIVHQSGFNNHSYFSSVFKEKNKVTPKNYRKIPELVSGEGINKS